MAALTSFWLEPIGQTWSRLPLHCGASNEIKDFCFWKVSKTKTFERGHFWSNFVQTFFIWCQITKILRTIFFLLTGQISGVFGEFVCGNSWRAGRRSLKFIPRMRHVMPQEKLENDKFLRTDLHCEFYIWNIQIFFKYFYKGNSRKN